MNIKIGFVIIIQILFFSGSALTQTAPGSVTVALTSKQIATAAINLVRTLKKMFEIEVNGVRNSRNQIFNAVNSFQNDLFKSLQNGLFIIEETKAKTILNILMSTPDLNCANRLNNIITDIKNKDAKNVFQFCKATIDAEITQIKEVISNGQRMINTALSGAEVGIGECERVYNIRQNFTQFSICIAEETSSVQTVVSRIKTILANRTSEKIVNILANCTDTTVFTIKTALNLNYDTLRKCLNSSSNKASRQLASEISKSYKVNHTINEVRDVATAIANIKANVSTIFDKVDAIKHKFKEVVTKRNRIKAVLKELILSNREVIKYQNAFFNASLVLNPIPAARRCVEEAKNQLQKIVNSKTDNLKSCLNSVELGTPVREVNNIENSVIDNTNKEGFVAVIKCLANGGLMGSTVLCSQQADSSFVNFLAISNLKLAEVSQKVDITETLVIRCENSVITVISANLDANADKFNSCLNQATSIKYKLL